MKTQNTVPPVAVIFHKILECFWDLDSFVFSAVYTLEKYENMKTILMQIVGFFLLIFSLKVLIYSYLLFSAIIVLLLNTYFSRGNPINLILTGIALADCLVMLEYIPFTTHMYILNTRKQEEQVSSSQ